MICSVNCQGIAKKKRLTLCLSMLVQKYKYNNLVYSDREKQMCLMIKYCIARKSNQLLFFELDNRQNRLTDNIIFVIGKVRFSFESRSKQGERKKQNKFFYIFIVKYSARNTSQCFLSLSYCHSIFYYKTILSDGMEKEKGQQKRSVCANEFSII